MVDEAEMPSQCLLQQVWILRHYQRFLRDKNGQETIFGWLELESKNYWWVLVILDMEKWYC